MPATGRFRSLNFARRDCLAEKSRNPTTPQAYQQWRNLSSDICPQMVFR